MWEVKYDKRNHENFAACMFKVLKTFPKYITYKYFSLKAHNLLLRQPGFKGCLKVPHFKPRTSDSQPAMPWPFDYNDLINLKESGQLRKVMFWISIPTAQVQLSSEVNWLKEMTAYGVPRIIRNGRVYYKNSKNQGILLWIKGFKAQYFRQNLTTSC